jgi:hypothetical protein
MTEMTRSGFTREELDAFEITPETLRQGMAELDAIAAENGISWGIGESADYDTSERTRYKAPGAGSGRGTVRGVSEAQTRYLKRLFAERDTTNLKVLPGFNGVENVSLAGARHLIESLLACPIKANQPVRMATDKQASFIDSLAERKGSDIRGSKVTFADASATIDRLKAMPDAKASSPNKEPVVKGMVYKVGERVFRIQESRSSGNLYAMELIGDEFVYASGAIRLVMNSGEKVSMEERQAYGRRTAHCMDCGRVLRVKESVERGIGPICINK